MTAEQTTTLVIGSGFSALAMAAELDQQGIRAIVVDGSRPMKQHPTMGPTTGGISLAELSERSDIVRLLEHYARRHELDLRPETRALELTCTHQPTPMENRWQAQTASGILSAHSVVFTRSALGQLRRVLRSVGVTTTADVCTGMSALGLYLVGVGDLALPTTQEILHQARRAGQSISARLAASELGSVTALA
ncbi:FAD-binding protein [Arthrobacter sp. E3]|uniref:FAD-binding protein n=1 Tax=Arthrobacter sp. E3 TaxID=517402 RepID=UPI001A94BD19|nr:FAD-binding protein [Arthrobacter sp. E3]